MKIIQREGHADTKALAIAGLRREFVKTLSAQARSSQVKVRAGEEHYGQTMVAVGTMSHEP